VILEALDIRKLYGAYVALDGVSLSVREGEFVSIIGPNGAGKSTLINVLTGVLRPSGGTVRFKGQDIGGIGTVALTRLGVEANVVTQPGASPTLHAEAQSALLGGDAFFHDGSADSGQSFVRYLDAFGWSFRRRRFDFRFDHGMPKSPERRRSLPS